MAQRPQEAGVVYGGAWASDRFLGGVGAAAIAVALRTPIIVAVVLAAVVTALARLFLG